MLSRSRSEGDNEMEYARLGETGLNVSRLAFPALPQVSATVACP